jgi:hypothetical protein
VGSVDRSRIKCDRVDFLGVEARRAQNQQLAAKDAALLAKEAQIDSLRELTSTQVREHYLATKAQLEDYIEQLKSQVNRLQSLVDKRDADVNFLLDELIIVREIMTDAEQKLRVLKKDFRDNVGRPHCLDSAGLLAKHMVQTGTLTKVDAEANLSGRTDSRRRRMEPAPEANNTEANRQRRNASDENAGT